MLRTAILSALFLVLAGLGQGNAAITLTQVPAGMRKQTVDITVGWTGGAGRVHLRASTIPGGTGAAIAHYDSLHLPSQADAGVYTFRINPDIPVLYRNTDLRFGVNYCILTDGTSSSPEFIILIESNNAPSLNSPSNASSIKDLTPTFSWTGDAPFYAVLVSDEPFKISDSGTVTGVSAVWQIITPYTSARYGDPDPSGYNTVAAPPLISGKTYNWLVLNNYGNNSASTSKVAPVPFSFVYSPAAPLPSPVLLEPNNKDTIPGSDQILFRWSLVDGAVSYKLELLEENLVDGSQADISLWKATSTGGQIVLDNATGLLRRYNYKWRVYAIGNNGAASLSEKRSFFYSVDVGNVNITLKNQAGQKIAYAPIKVNRLGGSSSAAFQSGSTDNDGLLTINNAPLGSYEARVDNLDGYSSKTDTIIHASKAGTSQTITLSPVLGKILGKVSAAGAGTGILNAKVTVTGSNGTQWTAVTNSQGNYSLGVPYGNWQVRAQADGYQASATASISLNSSTTSSTVDLALDANKFTLSGTVANSFSHQGIFGATVFLTQNGETRTANTDGNGSFSFSVPTGSASLRVSSAGFAAPEQQTFTVDGDKSVNLSLDPNASILSGRCKDNSGTGLSGVLVQATPKSGPVRGVLSDNQGYFELSLPAGDWILTTSAKGFSSLTSRKFLLDVSKTVQGVDFTLQANQSFITGRSTVNGAGLAGVKITAGDASALTDNSGYYLLSVNAGTQSVSASKEGYLVSKTYSVPVNPGDTVANIDFPASGNAGVVKGRALAGGAAVVQASIKAVNQGNHEAFTQVTGSDGAYALSLPGGDYQVTAAKEGFALDAALSLTLPPGGTILDANLRLLPDQAGLSGTVATGNVSLGGCEVAYQNASVPALTGKTVTDPQGRYSLSLQAGAIYALTATCQGYQGASQTSPNLTRGGAFVLDFNLSKAGATYRGKMVESHGNVLAAVKVTAEKGGEAVSVATDFTGSYSLSLGAGSYTVTFSKSGYRTMVRAVNLALGDNQAASADTLTASVGKLAGRILSEGSGVPGAFVTLTGLSPEAGGGAFTTDADGRFSGDNLPAGNYGLAASADGFADGKIASLTLVAGQLTNAEISLIPNRGSLAGTVNSDGNALPGVTVTANAFGISRSAVTGADGKYKLDKLPAGVYSLSAGLAGFSADRTWDNQTLSATGALASLDFLLSKNAGSLSGTVTGADISTGIRLSLVGKKGSRAYATCDGAGKYSFPSLPADDYTLTITAPGYKLSGSTQAPVVSLAGAQVFNPTLLPAVFRLAGKLLNQAELPIAGLPMELSTSRDLFKTTTAGDGSFSFSNVPAGDEYKLACKPPTADYDARDTTFALGLDAAAQVAANLHTLSRQASLAGTVLLDDRPLEGAQLRISGNNNTLAALSQPNGSFKLTGIAGSDASISLNVSKAGANTLDTSLQVKVAEIKGGLVLKLRTLKLSVSLIVNSSEGKALAGAKVVVASARKLDTLTANSDGKIAIANVPANQSLTAATLLDKDNFDNLEMPILLKESDTTVTLAASVHATFLTALVKDQNGDAVDGAQVILNGRSLGITSQGKVSAKNLAHGDYRLAAGKAAYKSGPEIVATLSGDTTATVNLLLTKVDGGLYGTVSDTGLDRGSSGGVTSHKLPGAVVVLVSGSDTLRDTVNSLGQYFVNGLADGRKYIASLTLPGYLPRVDSVVANPQSQSLDLVLSPLPASVLGRVDGGKAGVRIRLTHAASGQMRAVATAQGGYYAFTGLENRSDYALQALDGSLSSQSVSFQANGSSAKRIDPSLELWGGAQGTVTGGTGSAGVPLGGVLLSARNLLTGVSTWTVSDSLGRFTLMGLATGKHDITAERKGYGTSKPLSVTIAKGTTLTGADFTLEEVDAGIAGLVTDENGQALSALVTLAAAKDTVQVQTDGGGQFVFAGQAAGTYKLSAAKPGFTAPPPVSATYSGKGLKSQDLVLSRRKNSVLGVVRDAVTNTPVAGALLSTPNGTPATADSLGRFELALPAGSLSPVYIDVSQDGYLPRSRLPVFLEADGSSTQDIALTADYHFDGEIDVVVKEGKDTVTGLFLTVQPFHPDDTLQFSLTGKAPNSFRALRWPAPYTLRVKRDGFKDLVKVVDLTAKEPTLKIILAYPTSQIRMFVTTDGKHGKGVELSLNGQALQENQDTAGLYASAAKLKPGSYEVTVKDQEANLIPQSPYFIALGEDSIRTDTLSEAFFQVPIADSTLGSSFLARVLRKDTLNPMPGVLCSLYYRFDGDPTWKTLPLDSTAGGFAAKFPEQTRPGAYQYYHVLRSPSGARIQVVTPAGTTHGSASVGYSDIQAPGKFTLRDPFLLFSVALLPQRLEADTSLYSLGARDLYQVQMRGEAGRNLNAYFDQRAGKGDTGVSVAWKFANPSLATAMGLSLTTDSATPRLCHFHGGNVPSDSILEVICSARMGTVSLKKSLYIRIQDLWPVSVGIKYVKENRELEQDGATLLLSNQNPSGYLFSAFAKTADGRIFNISPRWSFGADSAVGTISQQGLFIPDSLVARSAALRIYDTLAIGLTNVGATIHGAFVYETNVATFTQVVPAAKGRALVSNGEGTFLDFNLAGLSKAFTVSVKKPKVSGLLRSSPQEEVVGEILDIELSERQPFKADSGAVLTMPVSQGIAQKRTVYLGHWNSARLAWEKVDSAKADTAVDGHVYSFSKYAVIMGSLPLGAYDFTFAPNPFSAEDPWGLQLSYKVSSDVSSQVGVRVEVYNMMGDKVYQSEETQLSKGDVVKPGLKKAALNSSERKTSLGPYVWDGHDSKGVPCRNGRYLVKLIVKDGQGSKTYLKKVVMLK